MNIVTVWDTDEDGLYHNVICNDNDTLATLLLHIKPRYKVVNIQVIENLIEMKEVVVENINLEHGGN